MAIQNPKTEYSKREKFVNPDECYTPEEAIYPLLPYLDKSKVIWDCAFGSGRLAEHFNKFGLKVVGHQEVDFFERRNPSESLKWNFDMIITNPPYSKKDKFLKKCFEIGKPFALLLPTTALGEQGRNKLFRKYGIQLIVPDKRINFEIPSGKKSSWFHTSWFCGNMNLPKDINFVELKQEHNNQNETS